MQSARRSSPTASRSARASSNVDATAPAVPAMSSTISRVSPTSSSAERSSPAARSRASAGSPGPPEPACTTNPAAPAISHAATERATSSSDFAWNSGFGEAMFTRYGACT
jgi:hypothetical protein